ncbi:MAG: polynucleotide adenylyltransferase PcnB [Steroidobacteraceae bacterium]
MSPSNTSDEVTSSLARVVPRDSHSVSRAQISANALRVLYRLKDSGFQAFLVGGCVRDLLIGIEPKDFDIATNALPEEVRKLFRNCRLVGRRFRLAHVFFGREIIEVATFRAASAPPPGTEGASFDPDADADAGSDVDADGDEGGDEDGERVVDHSGRILADNIYGSIDEDVWRRDFTANALYYNIRDFSIWDYVAGLEDIAARRLRLIGDAETRYREDPVRMLRAARFEAKLGFTLDAASAEPIESLRELLAGVPPARLFDETLKLFLSGHALASLASLRRHGLLRALLPPVAEFLDTHPTGPVAQLLELGLGDTDARLAEGRSAGPAFLFAILMYGPIVKRIEESPAEQWHDSATIAACCDDALRELHGRVALPRRYAFAVREMFTYQPRLEAPRGRRALRLLEQPRFRAAFDLLQLRARSGAGSRDAAAWWQRLQNSAPDEQQAMSDALAAANPNRAAPAGATRRRRGGRRRAGRARTPG